ncbi:MAG: hypothetical protein RLZZ606_1132 [Actinomycetota bacterium]
MVEPLFHKDDLNAEVGSVIELDGPEGKHAVSVGYSAKRWQGFACSWKCS